jgi:ribonuclease HI
MSSMSFDANHTLAGRSGGPDSPARVFCYTDGACSGNPGPGGYGAILQWGPHRRELSAGFRLTTNQRMELRACIAGLEALNRPCPVTVVTDSLYVVKGMQEWVPGWIGRGWRRAGNKRVENLDLWQRLHELAQQHETRFEWVKGHDGHPENERADELARTAIGRGSPALDEPYERARAGL